MQVAITIWLIITLVMVLRAPLVGLFGGAVLLPFFLIIGAVASVDDDADNPCESAWATNDDCADWLEDQ